MTPYEKAKAEEGRVNYCDECEQFEIVGNAAYCKVDGKLISPIMMARGQGTGPAWNCKKRRKPITNADRIRSMSDEELAEYFTQFYYDGPKFYCPAVADVGEGACAANYDCRECWLKWLKQEEHNEIY